MLGGVFRVEVREVERRVHTPMAAVTPTPPGPKVGPAAAAALKTRECMARIAGALGESVQEEA